VIATTGTLILAAISWLVVEKPLNQLKRYFPYISPGKQAHIPSPIRPDEPDGREYDTSGYHPSYANRDGHGS
jgi:peptidoglycan/LPS O-acetylase OafA/YrhL